jgi:hypothetical protein
LRSVVELRSGADGPPPTPWFGKSAYEPAPTVELGVEILVSDRPHELRDELTGR